MKHPISVLTNLAYLYIGVEAMLSGHPSGPWVGACFWFLGIGSGYFHFWQPLAIAYPSEKTAAQLFDERGMYLTFCAMIGGVWMNFLPQYWCAVFLVAMIILGVFLASYASHPKVDSMKVLPPLVIALLIGVGLTTEWATAGKLFAGFLLIEMWRELPERNFWSPPRWLKGLYDPIHGIWHLGTAFLMRYSYLYPMQ